MMDPENVKKQKPKYNLFQNSGFLIGLATAPLHSLITAILLFTGLLMAVHAAAAYIDIVKRDGWQFLFVHIVAMSSENT